MRPRARKKNVVHGMSKVCVRAACVSIATTSAGIFCSPFCPFCSLFVSTPTRSSADPDMPTPAASSTADSTPPSLSVSAPASASPSLSESSAAVAVCCGAATGCCRLAPAIFLDRWPLAAAEDRLSNDRSAAEAGAAAAGRGRRARASEAAAARCARMLGRERTAVTAK